MRKSSAPNEPSPMTLNAWMERPKVIGIVRARLLDEDSPWPLGVGSWFSPLPSGFWPDLPQALRDGVVPIGHAGIRDHWFLPEVESMPNWVEELTAQ